MEMVVLPESLAGLWEACRRFPAAVFSAGGTDLLVQLRAGRRPEPEVLIGLKRVPELREITVCEAEVAIGAAATQAEIVSRLAAGSELPLLVAALGHIGSPQIRNMGTLGGNLVTASPAGDSLPALYLYDAEVELWRPDGKRRIKVAEFITGPGRTGLAAGEIVGRILLPRAFRWSGHYFEKVGLRRALAIAVVSLAALWRLDGEGRVAEMRLAWGSLGPTIVRLPEVEDFLLGKPLSRESLAAAGVLVRERVRPIDDIRASAAYRREVAARLLLRLAQIDR